MAESISMPDNDPKSLDGHLSLRKITEENGHLPEENPNEEPTLSNEHLASFKQRLEREEIQCRKDDMFLLSFLRTNKFDQDRAYDRLKKYYKTRKSYPELFDKFTPRNYLHLFQRGMFRTLPNPDKLGRVIYLVRNELETDLPVTFKEFACGSVMALEFALQREVTQKNGIVAIYDANYLRWSHLLELTPRILSAILMAHIGAFPIRFKEIHFVNISKIFRVLFQIAKPFLPKKFRRRMHFHGYSWESIHEHVGKHLLPKDVGGTLEDDKLDEFVASMLEQQEKFEEYEEYWSPRIREETN